VNAAGTREKARGHYGLTLMALVSAAMAYALSQTLVSPALPVIQRELGTSTTAVTFVLTAYLLSASVATPIVGRLGDMFGKERMMVVTLGCFAAGSLVAALATSIEVMIAGRVIQGVGGAIFPLAFGIIRDEAPRHKVAAGIGLISATFGIGGGVGLVLSGLIVDNLSYHWVYWVGLIVVLASLVLTHFFVPESPVKTPARIDWTGATLLSAGLVAVLVAVSEGNHWGWASAGILALFGGGAALFGYLVMFELRHPRPLVDMRMLARRAVAMPNVTGFLVGFGMFGSFIIIPQFVQMPTSTGYGFGATVTQAGIFMLPSTATMLLAGPLAGWMGGRIGSKGPLIIGTSTMVAAFAFLAAFHDDRWSIYVGTGLLGFGIGFAYAAMANLIIEAVEQTQTGAASGINTIMRTIGGTLGGQISASIIAASIGGDGMPTESGFTGAFVMSAVGLAFATAVAFAIPGRRRTAAAGAAPAAAPVAAVAAAVAGAPAPDPLHPVAGVIRSPEGARVAGASVVLLDREGLQLAQTSTDAEGRYTFGGVRGGEHTLVVLAPGFGPTASGVTVPPPAFDVVVTARGS
jgi:EmrB/QacA subfamily drug resistance transporter